MIKWPASPIGDVARVIGGGTPTRSNPAFYGGDIPWVTPKDMKRWNIDDSQVRITGLGLESSAAKLAPAGSVLVVVRSGVLKHTLPVAITKRPVAINQDLKALICSDDLDPSYLAYFIKERSEVILKWVRATTADNFPIGNLMNLHIPLPPIDEQRRIVKVLDDVGALRVKRQESMDLLGGLTRSIFVDMFGDPVVNSKNLPQVRITDLGTLDRGVSKHRPRNDPMLLGGKYPLIQTGDVAGSRGYIRCHTSTYSEMGLAQSRLWPAGTLCITIAANIAKTGILQFDACFPDSVVGFTSDPAVVEYVQVWLSFLQGNLERMAPESAQKNINLATLRGLRVPDPGRDLIEEFANRIRVAVKLNSTAAAHLAELDALFHSIQHRAFDGKLWLDSAKSAA